jgi:deoxyribose-phosphate aldolase
MTDQHLVDVIVRTVLAQLRLAEPEAPCACHAVPGGCCPDRLGLMLGHGAERFGLQAGASLYPREIARLIDHTLLKPEATRAQIETLCREAREHGFATVCVNPTWVRLCAELLRGSESRVCTVAGFPLGASVPEVKALEGARAVEDGATEVDMVMNVGALKSRDYRLVERDVASVVAACRPRGAWVKVIIEAALLDDDEKVKACVIARAAGADFVKTSTGFGPGGATAADVALMRRVVGTAMGVKAAGGVRDLKSARELIAAGADRIGASVGVKIVQESQGAGSLIATTPGAPAGGGY